MDWRDVPSLAALRAFEAAARNASLSAAARELNVTHAAVAQHVRTVEAHLGVSLLVREGRQMALTDQGRALAMSLADGFGQIIAGVRAVTKDDEARPLVISVTPSFAENWLMPRLAQFWTAHPEISLSITPDTRLVDLQRDRFDMAIRYGDGNWPGLEVQHLTPAGLAVVATPALLEGCEKPTLDDVAKLPWLFEVIDGEYRKWTTEQGLDLSQCQINEVATLGMLLSAVRAGAGVSAVPSALVRDDIASGRLLAIAEADESGLDYYLVHRRGVVPDRLKTFKKWLLQCD